MLKLILKIVFTAIVAFLLQLYLPWWSIAVAGLLIGFILSSSASVSFLSGFLGIAIYWGILSFLIDGANEQVLSERIAQIFSLPTPSLLILVTALIGGLVGGFGSLAGSYLRDQVLPVRKF